jgi:hypothetical protein
VIVGDAAQVVTTAVAFVLGGFGRSRGHDRKYIASAGKFEKSGSRSPRLSSWPGALDNPSPISDNPQLQ